MSIITLGFYLGDGWGHGNSVKASRQPFDVLAWHLPLPASMSLLSVTRAGERRLSM